MKMEYMIIGKLKIFTYILKLLLKSMTEWEMWCLEEEIILTQNL